MCGKAVILNRISLNIFQGKLENRDTFWICEIIFEIWWIFQCKNSVNNDASAFSCIISQFNQFNFEFYFSWNWNESESRFQCFQNFLLNFICILHKIKNIYIPRKPQLRNAHPFLYAAPSMKRFYHLANKRQRKWISQNSRWVRW